MDSQQTRTPDQTLQEIVRRIVAVARPDRIILFGSRARDEARPDSDYDILVMGPTPDDPYHRVLPVYDALVGLRVPKDVVWWTAEEADEWRNVKSHFITTVLREGRVLYERAA